MNRCVAILAVMILVLSACGRSTDSGSRSGGTSATTTKAAEASHPSTSSVQNPTGKAGNIPDPCTLLSDAEVTDLTGRTITQIDKDGADVGATVRYCQWQLASGQLAVFLSRTTKDEFETARADSPSISGVGDDAYWRDGHLFVLVGTIQLDVYVHGGDENQNQADAKKVATALLPKVRGFA